MADQKGSAKKSGAKPTAESLGLRKVNLDTVVVRRRNMLEAELFVKWDSYRAESTALAGTLISKVSVQAGQLKQPTLFNLHEIEQFPGDYVLEPTNQRDQSSIEARWDSPTKVYLRLESLLTRHPLGIPVDHKAYMKLTPYPDENGGYLHLHYSKPRFARIAAAPSQANEKQPAGATRRKAGTAPAGAEQADAPPSDSAPSSPAAPEPEPASTQP